MLDLKKLSAALTEARDLMDATTDDFDGPDDRPSKCAEFERDVLAIFVRDALDFPDSKWDVWKVMASELVKYNAIVRGWGEPEFRIISFEAFLRKVSEAERNPR